MHNLTEVDTLSFMSIYADCADAARWLLVDPGLHSSSHPGFFTELDVIALASSDYTDGQVRLALRECSTMLTKLYKRGEAVRFGPVTIPGLDPDYARIATKIVYASPEGPAVFETPNGNFLRLTAETDDELRPGRKFGTIRDDRIRWSKQDIEQARVRAGYAKLHPRKKSQAA